MGCGPDCAAMPDSALTTFPRLVQEVDPMRAAYYSDLCSKFMIENTILKMEYAEVRVFSISDKVGLEFVLLFIYLFILQS